MEKDRQERLLALLLLAQLKAQGATQKEKAKQLNLAGFTNLEIADLLETKASVISQVLYASRKGNK